MLLTSYLELLIADLLGSQLSAAWQRHKNFHSTQYIAHRHLTAWMLEGDYSSKCGISRLPAEPQIPRGQGGRSEKEFQQLSLPPHKETACLATFAALEKRGIARSLVSSHLLADWQISSCDLKQGRRPQEAQRDSRCPGSSLQDTLASVPRGAVVKPTWQTVCQLLPRRVQVLRGPSRRLERGTGRPCNTMHESLN